MLTVRKGHYLLAIGFIEEKAKKKGKNLSHC